EIAIGCSELRSAEPKPRRVVVSRSRGLMLVKRAMAARARACTGPQDREGKHPAAPCSRTRRPRGPADRRLQAPDLLELSGGQDGVGRVRNQDGDLRGLWRRQPGAGPERD